MAVAVLVAIVGYLAIFMAHYSRTVFFGYDFKHDRWEHWTRVAHAWLGYLALALALSQGATGPAKLLALRRGRQSLTFHGRAGAMALGFGALCVLLAVSFWTAWGTMLRLVITAATLTSAGLALRCTARQAAAVESDESSSSSSSEEELQSDTVE